MTSSKTHDSDISRDDFYQKALNQYQKGDLDGAEAIFANLVLLNYEDLESWLQLGLIREDKSNYRGAAEAYSAILDQDDSHSNVWTNLAAVYTKMKQYEKAESCLKIAVETAINYNHPRSEVWSNYGAFCAEVGRIDDALKMFDIALQINPQNEMAAKNLSEAKWVTRKKYLESLDSRNLASQALIRKCDPSWYYEYGTALRCEGDRMQAEIFLLKSIDMDSTNSWVHYELALVYYRNRELEKAEKYLSEAVKIDKENAVFWSTLGTIYSLLGKIDLSEEAHRIAVQLDEWDGRCWSQLGTLLLKTNRLAEASLVADKAVEVAPNLDMAWNLLGVVYLRKSYYQKAIHAFEKVVEINPGFADAWNNMALALEELGRVDDAIESCKKGIESGPHRHQAWTDLINLLHRANRHKEARLAFGKAQESGIEINMIQVEKLSSEDTT